MINRTKVVVLFLEYSSLLISKHIVPILVSAQLLSTAYLVPTPKIDLIIYVFSGGESSDLTMILLLMS
jgi:hypothetical protein